MSFIAKIRKSAKEYSCIVMGTGRSGTSLMSGLLVDNYQFFGNVPFKVSDKFNKVANPKGFFEDAEINILNDTIIDESGVELPGKKLGLKKNRYGGWLSLVDRNTNWQASPDSIKHIQKLTGNSKYLFKDPRFSYTFPIWREYSLQPVKFVVTFRPPGRTVESTLKQPLAQEMKLSFEQGLEIYRCMYENILEHKQSDTYFIHYDQILNKQVGGLEEFLGAKINTDFVDSKLSRSTDTKVDSKYNDLYKQLCELANYTDNAE